MSSLIQELIQAFKCLPGVGNKSAQRMTYYLLERDKNGATQLAETLAKAVQEIKHCTSCRTLTENELCDICLSQSRNSKVICVVETPADVSMVEAATHYNGRYFVLMGYLSPLDGIGPSEIGIHLLKELVLANEVEEVILATNTTVEGEATAHYIVELMAQLEVKVTRIAHGIPIGGELEFVNSSTLSHAFDGRQDVSS